MSISLMLTDLQPMAPTGMAAAIMLMVMLTKKQTMITLPTMSLSRQWDTNGITTMLNLTTLAQKFTLTGTTTLALPQTTLPTNTLTTLLMKRTFPQPTVSLKASTTRRDPMPLTMKM